jgi:hypothetical protein
MPKVKDIGLAKHLKKAESDAKLARKKLKHYGFKDKEVDKIIRERGSSQALRHVKEGEKEWKKSKKHPKITSRRKTAGSGVSLKRLFGK